MTTASTIDNLDIPAPEEQEPKRKVRKGLGRNEITMNLVSMLDLAFNILIFFIITANFAVHEGIITSKVPDIDGSAAAAAPPPPSKQLKINIAENGRLFVEGSTNQPQSFKQLADVLAAIQNNPANPSGAFLPTSPVVITPDDRTPWQDVVNAFNAAIKAKYSDVGFGKIKPREGQ